MKIGLIVYSKTGNTDSVAQRLMEKLEKQGHDVIKENIQSPAANETPVEKIELTYAPSIEGYDLLIFASPVWAFNVSTVMKAYLAQVESLQGRRVSVFLTQMFPYKWMGGVIALNQFKKICQAKGAEIVAFEDVCWSNKNRQKNIDELVEKFSKI